ncbi:MAG TPA: hypothetical protein PLH64_06860 [Anaerolineaceae bacterium]|jgi:hypothetical protein|nr:hypothetical protein [Anaerolineaceae bacterium]HQJ32015.1 hypothetical protein [Anaerolineaceae bacterium]
MIIKGFSQLAIDQRDLLLKIAIKHQGFPQPIQQKIAACPYEVLLIGGVPHKNFYGDLSDESQIAINKLHQLWNEYWGQALTAPDLIQEGITKVNMFGEAVNRQADLTGGFIYQLRTDPDKNIFFIMLQKFDRVKLPVNEILFLLTHWKLEEGYLPLHCSGVIHKGGLYLFSGPSGAGKTTISRLSAELGDEVLDEDQVLIYLSSDGRYFADAWGYSFKRGHVPIKAFFSLTKANSNDLEALSTSKTAQIIFEQTLTVIGKQHTHARIKDVFQKVAQLARAIPGYELRFTKSAEFWKLIDEEFSVV